MDHIPAQFRVQVIRRPRYGCRACENAVVQAPAPDRPIDGGMATEALVAHVLISKYATTFRCIARRRSLPARASPGSFHVMQLGRPRLLVAGPAARADPEHGAVVAEGVCRRYDAAGA